MMSVCNPGAEKDEMISVADLIGATVIGAEEGEVTIDDEREFLALSLRLKNGRMIDVVAGDENGMSMAFRSEGKVAGPGDRP